MPSKREIFAETLQSPNLRSEYRSRLAECLRGAWSYRGTEAEFKSFMENLTKLEGWLNRTFGLEEGKRFPAELEEAVTQAWRPEAPNRTNVADALGIAAKQFSKRIAHLLEKPTDDQSTILTIEIDGVILPPDEKEMQKGEGASEFNEAWYEERTRALIETLQDVGIYADDLILVRGQTRKKMMRKLTYTIVEIPRLNREVLVCDEVGEGTFVIYGISDRKILLEIGKEELRENLGALVTKIVCREVREWAKEVRDVLMKDVNLDELRKIDVRTMEGLRREIQKIIPTPERWAEMTAKEKRAFKAFGVGLKAIARKFGIEGDPSKLHFIHLRLGNKIYGEGHECLRPKEITTEVLRAEILKLIPTAEKWAGMEQKEKLRFKAAGLGFRAIATKFCVERDPAHLHTVHLELGRKIYGEEHKCLAPQERLQRKLGATPEDLRGEIQKIVPTAEQWADMTIKEKGKLKIFGLGLTAIATKFSVEGDPFIMSVFLELGKRIYGSEHDCLSPKKATVDQLWAETLKHVPTPEEWLRMTKREKSEFKIAGLGLIAIARKFGVEGDPVSQRATHLELGRKIYGEKWMEPK